MPLTSAYWPLPLTAVVQSVFMLVLLASSMETPAKNQDSVCASNSSVPLLEPMRQPPAAEGGPREMVCGVEAGDRDRDTPIPGPSSHRQKGLFISARSRRAMRWL